MWIIQGWKLYLAICGKGMECRLILRLFVCPSYWWNSHIWHLFCKFFICHKFFSDTISWFLSSKLYFWQIVRINSGFPANNHSILPQSAKSLWKLFRFSHWKVNLCNSLKTVRESFTKTFHFPPKRGNVVHEYPVDCRNVPQKESLMQEVDWQKRSSVLPPRLAHLQLSGKSGETDFSLRKKMENKNYPSRQISQFSLLRTSKFFNDLWK